jgi:hypothetical protein
MIFLVMLNLYLFVDPATLKRRIANLQNKYLMCLSAADEWQETDIVDSGIQEGSGCKDSSTVNIK